MRIAREPQRIEWLDARSGASHFCCVSLANFVVVVGFGFGVKEDRKGKTTAHLPDGSIAMLLVSVCVAQSLGARWFPCGPLVLFSLQRRARRRRKFGLRWEI